MFEKENITNWLEATEKNKEMILDKYGEVYIYKGKIVPIEKLKVRVKNWFKDLTNDD